MRKKIRGYHVTDRKTKARSAFIDGHRSHVSLSYDFFFRTVVGSLIPWNDGLNKKK